MKFRDVIYEWLLFENKEEIYKKYYSDIDRDNFIRIIKADPKTKVTNNVIDNIGAYAKLLLNIYRKGNLKFEDLPKANEYLTLVYRYQIPLDIKKINSIADLYTLVKGHIAKTEKSIASILQTLGSDEYDLLLNTESWYVFHPKTQKAASYLGVNTEWCTAWGQYSLNPNYKERTSHFVGHSSKGPLYIIINKENEMDKYQLHFETNQFKNPSDHEVHNRPLFFNERLELKSFFFPFLYRTDLSSDELRKGLSKARKFLSEDDYQNLLDAFIAQVGQGNDLIKLLSDRTADDDQKIEQFISGDDIVDISFGRSTLEIEVRELSPAAQSHYDAFGYLQHGRQEAYNYVYEGEYDSWNDEHWAKDMLNGYLETYHKNNVSRLQDMFGPRVSSYDNFHDMFIDDLYNSDKIKEGYIDKFVEGTGASLESAYDEEIKNNQKYLDISYGYSYGTIVFPLESLIEYIAKENIVVIDNLDEFLENYIEEYNLAYGDYFDMPEYQYVGPDQDAMDNLFDEFFEAIEEEFEKHPECAEEKKKLENIIQKYFKGGDHFENEFVKIKLIDYNYNKFDCERGVEVEYHNKKTNETHKGHVKVDNLVNYMQIEPLFERLSLIKTVKDLI